MGFSLQNAVLGALTLAVAYIAVTVNRINRNVNVIHRRTKQIMITQKDINAIVDAENAEIAKIGDSITSLANAEQAIKDEIQRLTDENPHLDFAGLQAASDQLHASTESLGSTVADVAGIVPADATTGTISTPEGSTTGSTTGSTATGDEASSTGSGGVVNSEAEGANVEPGTSTGAGSAPTSPEGEPSNPSATPATGDVVP